MNKFSMMLLKLRSWFTKLLALFFVVGFFSLGFFDELRWIKSLLESNALSFNIGANRFSAYLLIKSAIIIVILFWLVGLFSEFGEKRIKAIKGIKASNKALITKIFQIVVYFFTFLIALNMLGIDLTALSIFSGAVGIGLGFGLQKITANFISGLILIFEKSVKDGDLVELACGSSGFVRHMGARYALVETFDGKEIMVPNEDFITHRLVNWTYSNNKGRVQINLGISYESDLEKAMALMLEAATEHPLAITNAAPSCYLREFADSSVNLVLFFWVADVVKGRYGPKSDVMRSIWHKFKANDIVIPFPQRDVYIKNQKS